MPASFMSKIEADQRDRRLLAVRKELHVILVALPLLFLGRGVVGRASEHRADLIVGRQLERLLPPRVLDVDVRAAAHEQRHAPDK
eukprot:878837-Rhodomonas_salina.1